jgi:hypothetical protein
VATTQDLPASTQTGPGRLSRGWHRVLGIPIVAWGIVAVSLASGVATWRASDLAARADSLQRLATQELALRHQLRSGVGASVDQDLRVFGAYEQRYDAAVRLQRNAASVEATNPRLARRLTRQAQHERSVAEEALRYERSQVGFDEDGLATFDVGTAIRTREGESADLAALRRSPTAALAAKAQDKSTNLIGIALLLAASLFFLTIAQLTSNAISRTFGIAGALIVAFAVAAYVLVGG